MAALVGGRPADIVWTSGATEANNTVLFHAGAAGSGEAWISAVEHPCVLAGAGRWFPGRHRLIPVDPQGRVEAGWLAERWAEGLRPALVAVMAANNEIGVLQSWRDVGAWCRERSVPYFCDAAQWLGKLPAQGLGEVDFITGCAHKFGGVPGVGFLKCPPTLRGLLVGGPQEDGRRAGTENVPGALACAAALEAREQAVTGVSPAERAAWKDRFEERVAGVISGLRVQGSGAPRLWNTSALLLPAVDCRRRWVVRLDKLGFLVSVGRGLERGRSRC